MDFCQWEGLLLGILSRIPTDDSHLGVYSLRTSTKDSNWRSRWRERSFASATPFGASKIAEFATAKKMFRTYRISKTSRINNDRNPLKKGLNK